MNYEYPITDFQYKIRHPIPLLGDSGACMARFNYRGKPLEYDVIFSGNMLVNGDLPAYAIDMIKRTCLNWARENYTEI